MSMCPYCFGSGKIVVYKEIDRDENTITVKSCIEICSECNGSGFGKTQIPELYTEHDVKTAFWDGYQAGMEAAQPKWISVEERLPSGVDWVDEYECEPAEYLVQVGNAELACVAMFDGEKFIPAEYPGIIEERLFASPVTHWMPLPKPPMEGENG